MLNLRLLFSLIKFMKRKVKVQDIVSVPVGSNHRRIAIVKKMYLGCDSRRWADLEFFLPEDEWEWPVQQTAWPVEELRILSLKGQRDCKIRYLAKKL